VARNIEDETVVAAHAREGTVPVQGIKEAEGGQMSCQDTKVDANTSSDGVEPHLSRYRTENGLP